MALHKQCIGIGSEVGLTAFRDGRFRTFGPAEGLPDELVYHVVEDDRGGFWITVTSGALRFPKAELDELLRGTRRKVSSSLVFGARFTSHSRSICPPDAGAASSIKP